ncbi:MAG: alpha/beta fold hydrolase [Actinomycetota bacterium]
MNHFDIDGVRLEYRWVGPGPDAAPTLVMLHEGLGSVGMWRDFPDLLSQATGCGVLAYSRQGYGGSDPCALPRPLSYMHDEGLVVLPKVLEAAGVKRAILVGHSDGASITLIHAGSGNAPLVEGVVVMAPHVVVEDCCVKSISGTTDAFKLGGLRHRLARWHGNNVDCAFWGWNMAWLDPQFRKWDIRGSVARVTVPMLVIQGTDDEYGTRLQYDIIGTLARAPVELCILPDCAHSPHRDQPEKVLAAIAGFVTGLT